MQFSPNVSQHTDDSPGWGERLGYGAGNVGSMALFGVISSFLTIYLTNVALLDIAAVSLIMAVSRVFDGISDLIAGNIIDHTESRLGKARIWLLRMSLPLSLSAFLSFLVPAGLPEVIKYIYVFILYNLFSTVFFTFTQVALYSLVSLESADRQEQTLLGNLQSIFITLGSLICSLFFVKLLPVFSSDPLNPETQSGYTGAVAVFSLVAAIFMLIAAFTTRERVVLSESAGKTFETAGPGSFLQTAKALLRNRYWIFMFVITVMTFFNVQIELAGSAYFASYVLNDLGAISWILSSTLISSTLIQFVTPFLIPRLGKRILFLLGLALAMVGYLGFGLCIPNQTAMLALSLVKGMGVGIGSALQLGLIADTIHYTRIKSGVYSVGMGNAGITTARKIGHGIGAAVFGLVLSAAGFSAVNEAQHLPQPPAVATATTLMFVWVPMICYAVTFLFFFFFFHLEKELKALES